MLEHCRKSCKVCGDTGPPVPPQPDCIQNNQGMCYPRDRPGTPCADGSICLYQQNSHVPFCMSEGCLSKQEKDDLARCGYNECNEIIGCLSKDNKCTFYSF